MEKEKMPALVVKAQEGNNQALNDLFTETYNDVYYFALKTVKDETLAADITQETFVTVFQNINNLNDPVAYPAWSRQITYRHCLQHLKKQNREIVVDENEDEDGPTIFDTIQEDRAEFIPGEELDKDDFKKTILEMVDNLPEEQRTAVILYYYDELSVKQIAEIQGATEGTVKSRLNYARKAIKSSVENYEKKNNVKLHSVGVLPLLLWLFGTDAKACSMSATTAQTVASGVSTATGTTMSVSNLAKIGTKAVWTLWQKIVAGLAATAVAVGGTVAAANILNKPETSDLQNKETVSKGTAEIHHWEGLGEIDVGLNLSNENKFSLITEEMDEESIKGTLTVQAADGSSYKRTFEGVGRVNETLHSGSIFYDVKLNEEVEKYFSDLPGYTELTLRYDTEKECFDFYYGPYDAVLEKIY